MSLPRVRLGLLVFLSLIFATPSTAQYMYLDSNGDGVNTAADQVNPSGPTVIDLWIDTDSNRDGSAAVCVNSDDPLNIMSYTFVLRAVGGTVTWGTFANLQPQMGFHFNSPLNSNTEFRDGYGGTLPALPPGTYKLGALQLAVLTGSPSIQIVPGATSDTICIGGPCYPTSFGTACLGENFDNTYKLGDEWSDVDGLIFGTEGGANGEPILTQPADMSVLSGETASQELTASDADRQPLTFSKFSGPAYATVANVEPGAGNAAGKVFVAPRSGDVGTAMVVVQVTDGDATDQKSFTVTVGSGAIHPPVLTVLNDIEVVAGTSTRHGLTTIDPDGQPIAFSLIAGPDFAQVSTLSFGPGAGAGSLQLTPGLCDAGPSTATLGTTDGVSTDEQRLEILVRIPSRATASPPPYSVPPNTGAVAVGDLNSDGHLDVAIATGTTIVTLSILLGNGDGTLDPPLDSTLPGGVASSIAIGDFDRDGKPDLAVTAWIGGVVAIQMGRGDGSFSDGARLAAGPFPQSPIALDFDRNGTLDLAVANRSGATVELYLGAGDGTFGAGTHFEVGSSPYSVAVGDFDRDGLDDLAVSNSSARTIGFLPGFGDGTFADHQEIPFDGIPWASIAADWNWDGNDDLAFSDYLRGKIVTLLGNGDGTFSPGGVTTGFGNPQSMAEADFDADGNLDLLVGDPSGTTPVPSSVQILYGRGDGTFGTPRTLAVYPSEAVATGDMNEDGYPDAILAGGGNRLVIWLNDQAGLGAAEARAFSKQDSHRFFSVLASLTQECIRLEPVAGSYQNAELNQRSIIMRSEGTGSVSEIPAIPAHRLLARDLDRNGVAEVPVCFGQRDFDRLFDKIRGRQTVTAHIEGALANGRRFCTPIELNIVGHRRRFAASITPNPLNPQATMLFSTSDDGFVRIRMYDLNGRLVRTLLDQPNLAAGDHEVIVDGRGQNGARLASGIYFYEIEAQEGTIRGRMTVLK